MPAAPPGFIIPTGESIALDAKRYDGQGYVYGGPAARPGDWDCSSFVSYVLGHDLGLGLPGGRWAGPGMPPAVHGPVVLSYVQWGGADPVPAGQEQPGDLVCWPGLGTGGHIGIVTGTGQMCSALNPNLGTLVSPIAGYGPTNRWVFRRVKGTGATPPPSQAQGGHPGQLAAALLAGLVVGGGAILLVLGAAAALGVAVAWAAARTVTAGGGGYAAAE